MKQFFLQCITSVYVASRIPQNLMHCAKIQELGNLVTCSLSDEGSLREGTSGTSVSALGLSGPIRLVVGVELGE